MTRTLITATLTLALAGCASATGQIAPGALGVTARDAYIEARSVARSWSADARLRWAAGDHVAPDGIALPDDGRWEFHFTAPDESDELLVRVLPLETTSEEQPATSPPGYVIGDNALDEAWIDSPAVMDAVQDAGATVSARASLLLVPTRPARWLVRVADGPRWQVNAGTGEVLAP